MFTDIRISGLVVEYIVAIDVTRVRFPADAFLKTFSFIAPRSQKNARARRVGSHWAYTCQVNLEYKSVF